MTEPKRAEPIEFHAEHWLHTFGGVNRVAICAAPVELPRNGAVEEIKRRGFTIDGQSYELLGVGCHMPAAPIHPGELIELLVAEVRKRAEPVNEYADKLRELGNDFWRYRQNSQSALCHSAAGEIERLELVVERLAARVRELEGAEPAETELLERDLVSMARLLGRAKAVERPWLPIESAPRDGTRVELWVTASGRGYPMYAVWDECGAWLTRMEIVRGVVTHWRREPAGPSASPPLPSG